MIIKELSFVAFCKVFKGHDDMLAGIGFTKHGTVDVLLTPMVTWHITRSAGLGDITVESEESEDYKAHTFTLDADDFDEITIC